MNKKRKALLLSALVLPGLGQLVLKRYKSAVIIIVATVISLIQIMQIAFAAANDAVNSLMRQGMVMDMQAINQAATQSADQAGYGVYTWILICCWLISLFDIGFVKHRADKQA